MKKNTRPVSFSRRLILASGMLPALLSSSQALTIWDGSVNPYDLNVNPTYGEGLIEGFVNAADNETTPNPANGPSIDPNTGFRRSAGLRMAQSTAFGATLWANNRTWIYTGEVFTGPNGIISFAANNDDTDWLRIDGVVVLNDNAWDTTVATRVTGLTPNTWVPFEYRVSDTGVGGAGPSGQNVGGASNWNNTIGAVMSHNDESLSLNALAYDLGRPEEVLDGTPTLFRYLASSGASPDIVQVRNSSTVQLSGSATTFAQNSILFNPLISGSNPLTLTFNNSDATQRTLGSQSTTLAFVAGQVVNIAGTGHFAPGALTDNNFTGVELVKLSGSGDLILDNQSNDLDGVTIKVVNGRLNIQGSGFSPVSTLTAPIQINGTGAIVRFGGKAADQVSTTFNPSLEVNESGTIEHVSDRVDTLTGNVNIASARTLTANIGGGTLRITGNVNGPTLTKTGNAILQLNGTTTLDTLNINAGRLVLNGNTTLQTSPTIASGATLALTGQTATYTIPTPLIAGPGATLEAVPGAIGTTATSLSGGTLVLDGPKGLISEFWNVAPPSSPVTGGGTFNANWGPETLNQGVGLANGTNTAGSGDFTAFQNHYAGLGAAGFTVLSSAGDTATINFPSVTTAPFIALGVPYADNIQVRMSGKFLAPTTGVYTFTTTSDDGSALFINGQSVAYNNRYQGMTNRGGTVFLNAGLHDIVIGFYEGGGGAGLQAFVTQPGGGAPQLLTNNSLFQNGDPVEFNNPVTVSASSTIHTAYFSSSLANLTLNPGVTLRTTGNRLVVGNVVINATGAYTFNTDGVTNLMIASVLNDAGLLVTLNKEGLGTLVLDNTTTAQLQNAGSIINLNNGLLGVMLQTGGNSPTGNAAINFNGGGLVLSSKGGDQTYALPSSFGGTSPAVRAQRIASGVAGPVVVTLTGNVNVPNTQTLRYGTADSYRIVLSGSATGTGTISVEGGRVEALQNGAFGTNRVVVDSSVSPATLNMRGAAPLITNLSSVGGQSTVSVGDGVSPSVLTLDQTTDTVFAGTIIPEGATPSLSVVKTGSATLTLSGTNTYTGGTTINAGTIIANGLALGSGPITLAGGTLQASPQGLLAEIWNINPPAAATNTGDGQAYNPTWGPDVLVQGTGLSGGPNTPGSGNFVSFQAHYNSLGAPGVSSLSTSGGVTVLNFPDTGGAPFAPLGALFADDIQTRFSGRFYAATTGVYAFSTTSDDGSALFINGQSVVDNNRYQGMTNRGGTVYLTQGEHDIVIGFYEGGGGAGLQVFYTPPGGGNTLLPNALLGGYHNSNPILVTANSTINPAGGRMDMGPLTVNNGQTLAIGTGVANFPSTTLNGAGGTFGINATGTVALGPITSAGAATLNKSGTGDAVLSNAAGQFGAGSTINVNAGRVVALGSDAFGAAAININNAGVGLSSTDGPQTYANVFNFTGTTANIAAGNFGGGAVDGQTVSLTTSVPIPATNTVTFSSANGYTLSLNEVAGNGTMQVSGGNVVSTGAVTTGPLQVTAGTYSAAGGLIASSVAVSPGAIFQHNGAVTSPGGITVGANGEMRSGGGTVAAALNLNGGILRATAGLTDFGNNPISAPTRTFTNNALRGVLHITGFDGSGSTLAPNNNGGVLAMQTRVPEFTVNLTTQVAIPENNAADAAFATLFASTPLGGRRFTAGFIGRFTATEAGVYSAQVGTVDDDAGFWVDLNQNGVFETNGSAGNELISDQGCCGDGPVGQFTLVNGQTYNVAVGVEDTGGDSGLTIRFQRPSDPGLINVNPGDLAQAGLWSFANPATGGGVIVEAGAELRAPRIVNGSVVALAGTTSTLRLNSPTPASDTLESLSSILTPAGTATIDIGPNNTLTATQLSVSPGGTLVKTGAGTLIATQQSLGDNGILQVDVGLVRLEGTANAFFGALPGTANGGNVVVNNSATVSLTGSIRGQVSVNSGGTLTGTGSAGSVLVSTGGAFKPGTSPGTFTVDNLTLDAGANFEVEIASLVSFDKVIANVGVTLNSATLNLVSSNTYPDGSIFTIIDNTGANPVNGTFLGLADDAEFTVGGQIWRISYDSFNTGNDVQLLAVPEPGAVAMLIGGFATLIGLQRTRRRRS